MGYVWCDGYVRDMCGVRYANNLLKNPATKRLSGKVLLVRFDFTSVSTLTVAFHGRFETYLQCWFYDKLS